MLLLVIIYVECIYVVVGDYICWVHICWWWNLLHAIGVVMLVKACIGICWCGLVKLHEACLLLSSPSSHTLFVVFFHLQLLLLNTSVFIMQVVMMFLLHQGRRPRRWKEVGTTRSWVGLDTLYVSRKSHVCYELGANTCRYICMLDDCCSWNLMLVYSLMRILCSCLFMQDIINDACLILFIFWLCLM